MPRRVSNFVDQIRDREDYVEKTWRRRESPDHYYEVHHVEEYPKTKLKKSKNRTEWTSKSYGDVPRKDFAAPYPLEEEDPDDYETYSYEYKTQTYLKSPRDSSDHGRREYRKAEKYNSPPKKHSIDTRRKSKYEKEYKREYVNEQRNAEEKAYSKQELYPSDRDVLNHAATKIQAVFRGYQTRKEFWKKLEQYRRQSFENAKKYGPDEYTIASVTSIVDDASVSNLATNADPNLGLTGALPYLDSSQRHNIVREIKSTLSFSEDISTVSQLQTESSPTIVVMGGVNPLQAKDYILGASMFVYNIQKDKWFFGGTMPEPRNYHTTAYLSGKIYVIGGYSPLVVNNHQMVATQTVFQLSVRSKRWRKRADMHQARACHGMCVVNDNIVVMGGRDVSGKLLSTVEMYYPLRDQWVLLKSMPEAIMGFSCSVLDGCIFIIGGIVNEGHISRYAVSNRTYAFDFEKQMWYRASLLPEPRAFASAATLKREIWLWGGVKDALNEDGFLLSTNSVFVYNLEVSKWEQHITIGTLKHATAIAKCGRKVYILGGMSNAAGTKEVLNENDYYNRESDKYMEGASLPRPLAGTAAVALPIDYIATSDPKWNAENINEDSMNEAATKIQSVFRGYRTRSMISNHKFVVNSLSNNARNKNYGNAFIMHASIDDPYGDKWKAFQRVQIEDWPPVPNPQISSSDVSVRCGILPRGYTVTNMNNQTNVRRYVLLPPHADPNLSMVGHLCNANKRAKKILGLRKVERLPSFAVNLITAPKLQDHCLPMILVMGGLQPKDPVNMSYGKLILRYHILKDRFEYFGALPEPRNFHAAVYYQENIYVTGGCDPDKRNSGEMVATNNTYCLNIHSSEWVEKCEMHCSRAFHNLVVALGKIFAIGGRDNNGRLVASIEAYDVESDKWSVLRPMVQPRMGMACAVIDDHIWCMGGLGVSEDSDSFPSYPVLASCISYDIGKDVWISRPPLRCPRAFGSCVVVNNRMWLVGGVSKDPRSEVLVSMASVDKYNPTKAQWYRKTVISNPRHCAAVVAVDSNIYILGGVSSQEWCPLARNEMIGVEDLSLHTASPLPEALTGIAAVAVPPVLPSLRAESLAILLHSKLTYH